MDLDPDVCFRAVRSRDERFDGRLFVAVVTTGIYCRPVCPAPPARRENIRYFEFAAAAQRAGYRPCMRCRPEVAPWTPAWNGASTTVSRALRLIGEGSLDGEDVEEFAARLGVGSRQLRRLFLDHVGAPPIAVAQARRVHFARTLIEETALPITEIALAAGFRSVRRFNSAMKSAYRAAPREMRRRRSTSPANAGIVVRLAYRAPFDWTGILGFLRNRAIPGVERVDHQEYARAVAFDRRSGIVRVRDGDGALVVSVSASLTPFLKAIVDRVRRLFDLSADPDAIGSHLRLDPMLRPLVSRWPGIRVPGAWEPFELAVRAVVGQQISVAAATTLMGRIAARYGSRAAHDEEPKTLFPRAEQLAVVSIEGMPASRSQTLRTLAEMWAQGSSNVESLHGVAGIGPWTRNYIAMRAFSDPDAFPSGDLVLRRAAGGLTDRNLLLRAERWRPWRAYAALLLWRSS